MLIFYLTFGSCYSEVDTLYMSFLVMLCFKRWCVSWQAVISFVEPNNLYVCYNCVAQPQDRFFYPMFSLSLLLRTPYYGPRVNIVQVKCVENTRKRKKSQEKYSSGWYGVWKKMFGMATQSDSVQLFHIKFQMCINCLCRRIAKYSSAVM